MDPLETGKLIVMLAGLAGLYLKLNQAVRSMAGKGEAREITNNPVNVQETSRPATMEDVNAVSSRVSRLEEQIVTNAKAAAESSHENGEKIDDLRDRVDDKFGKLADDVQELTRAVGRLEGT